MAATQNTALLTRRARGRPQGNEAQDAILSAAYAILEEAGLAGFTIEGVAARAGAAKTTIYRWWPNREALAVAAFLAAVEPVLAFPRTSSAEAAIRSQMLRLASLYRGKTGHLIRSLIAAAHTNAAAGQAFVDNYIRPRREAAMTTFERGIAAGEFRAELNPETVIDTLYGPIFFRLLVQHGPLDDAWVDQLATVVFGGCRATKPPRQPRPHTSPIFHSAGRSR